MPEDGIGPAAGQLLQSPYANLRPPESESLRRLVAEIWSGAVPKAW